MKIFKNSLVQTGAAVIRKDGEEVVVPLFSSRLFLRREALELGGEVVHVYQAMRNEDLKDCLKEIRKVRRHNGFLSYYYMDELRTNFRYLPRKKVGIWNYK